MRFNLNFFIIIICYYDFLSCSNADLTCRIKIFKNRAMLKEENKGNIYIVYLSNKQKTNNI